MAPGPLPKPREQRARRNIPNRGEWVDLAPITTPILPELPELAGTDWNARTRRLWEGFRFDPVTATFGPSEIALTIEWAHIHARAARDADAAMLRISAAMLDKLGLTPKGKRDLRYRVTTDAPAPVLASVTDMTTKRRPLPKK